MEKGLLLAGVVILAVFYALYVSLIKKKNKIKEASAGVDVQLKKRYDLIPNLLNMAAKYMAHEKSLMTEIVKLRADASRADFKTDPRESMVLDEKLNQKLKDFWLTVENYPDLKSDRTMVEAMQSFNEAEEHIAAARRFYNAAVNDFNNAAEIFPSSLVARLMGLKADMPYFEASAEAKERIDVNEFMK